LSKLKFYRVTGKTFPLIKSYLEDRQQRVILNDKYASPNTYSDWGKIKNVVPQAVIICISYFISMTYQKSHIINPK